ncbi:MAG: magnesium transporter [Phycisphaerae bacterium]
MTTEPNNTPPEGNVIIEEPPTPCFDDISAAEAVAMIPQCSAPDAAEAMRRFEIEDQAHVLSGLHPEVAAPVVAEMAAPDVAVALAELSNDKIAGILAEMDPDDRVDVLEHLPEDRHDEIIGHMEPEEAAEVRRLEQYEPDTAGGIMTTQVTSLYEHLAVSDAIEQIRKLSEEFEQLFYMYVVDRRGHLIGVLSMRDLILAKPTRKLHEVMIPEVRSVLADMDQEEVAQVMRKYGFLAMPVVDTQNRLIGLITIDDIGDVLEEEATEDVHRLFGAGAEERLMSPWWFSFKSRVGWLVVNLGTAFAAGAVVASFSGLIERLAVLAAFMPIVAGMGGNASAQAMAVAVRGMSLGEVDRRTIRHVLIRESIVGLLTGLIIGTLTGLIAYFYTAPQESYTNFGAVMLGVVIFAALVINHTLACVSGAGIPFIMKRLGFDPAQSATIFATTVTDVVGFFALLGLAFLAIRQILST